MKKFPEVSNGKRGWRMRKRKKAFLLKKETISSFYFRQCLSNQQHHFAVWCFGHHAYVLGRSVGWSLHQVNKGKYRRNIFVSYLFLSFLFCIFLLGLSLGKALRQPVNVGSNNITKIWSQISTATQPCP